MFFNKQKKKSSFVKAKTPEASKRQKAAIAAYYANKKRNPKRQNSSVFDFVNSFVAV